MVRLGEARRGKRGLISVFVWKDNKTGAFIRTALWDSQADLDAARLDMSKALEGADF